MCSKQNEDNEWFQLDYVKGICNACGFHQLLLCDQEIDPTNTTTLVLWRKFEKVATGKTREGEPKEVIRLQQQLTTLREFLVYAASEIAEFVLHNHTTLWQDKQFKKSIDGLRLGEVMLLIDFAENYSFKMQNEVQSEHWYSFQLTILVHITYTINPTYDPTDNKSKRLCTEYHYNCSNDRKYENLFVQRAFAIHWNLLRE